MDGHRTAYRGGMSRRARRAARTRSRARRSSSSSAADGWQAGRGRDARPQPAVQPDPVDDAAATTARSTGTSRSTSPARPSPRRPTRPPPSGSRTPVADAVRLADHWLDETTDFPSGVTSTAAWSRAEWIVGTTDVWKVLVEPIAESVRHGASAARCPRRRRPMAGPLLGMLGQARRRDARHPGRLRRSARSPARCSRASDIGLPLGARRQGRAGAGQRRGVRGGPRRLRGRRPALPRAARGRPPAAVRPRARGCATT